MAENSTSGGIDFIHLLRIIKKRWYVFIICIFAFAIFGIYTAKKQPGYYASTLFIAATATNGTQIEKVVASMVELRSRGGAKAFAEKLGISEAAGASLKTLHF